MSNLNDFVIENGVLKKYVGPGGDVILPEGITEVGKNAFIWCINLLSVTIPGSIKAIGDCAFRGCSKLAKVKQFAGIQTIGSEAFADCKSLYEITLPEGLAQIGDGAFKNCTSLQSISFPNSLVDIGNYAFRNCVQLAGSVVIPNRNCLIRGGVFQGCAFEAAELPVWAFPNAYSEDGVFRNCKNLRRVTLTTAVGIWHYSESEWHYPPVVGVKDSFAGTPLEIVFAPLCNIKDLPHVKPQAAVGFAELVMNGEKIEKDIMEGYKKYISAQKKKLLPIAVSHESLLLYMLRERLLKKDDVELGVELTQKEKPQLTAFLLEYQNGAAVRQSAKSETPLPEVIQKKSPEKPKAQSAAELKKTWKTTKLNDGNLCLIGYTGENTDITIPEKIGKATITEIKAAFQGNERLTSVIIPEGVRRITGGAFYNCTKLEDISFPSSLEEVHNIGMDTCITPFDNTPWAAKQGDYLIVASVLLAYRGDAEEVIIPEGVTTIGRNVFWERNGIKTVVIPNTMAEIPELCFAAMDSLTKMDIHNGVHSIGDEAFAWCNSLESVVISSAVTSIEPDAFKDCPNLTIHAPAGSYAEQYAKEHNIPFVAN